MSPLLSFDVEASGVGGLFWVWAATSLLLATALGFCAGVMFADRLADRGFRKAARKLSTLYQLVIGSLEKAQRATSLLESFPQVVLTDDQVERLEFKRSSLLDSLGRVIGYQRESPQRQIEAAPKPRPRPVKIDWEKSSIDAGTNLPDRPAFDANLRLMLESATLSGCPGGLLLTRIDRMDQLRARFGILGADVIVKAMAAVVGRSVRDQDLPCRLGADSFGVLMPSVDVESGRKLSQAIRNSVRFHTFRLNDVGPEVLVTASFGFTTCLPNDDPDLVLARAGDSLAQSIRRGRNHLHVFDGEAVVHCTAG